MPAHHQASLITQTISESFAEQNNSQKKFQRQCVELKKHFVIKGTLTVTSVEWKYVLQCQLALTTNVLQRETFYSDTLSTRQSL